MERLITFKNTSLICRKIANADLLNLFPVSTFYIL